MGVTAFFLSALYKPWPNETHHGYHGHIRGRALPPRPQGAARRAVRRGRRCRRSRLQGDRGASAQRRRTQEGSATRPEAWARKPTAEAVLRRLRRRAPPIAGKPHILSPKRRLPLSYQIAPCTQSKHWMRSAVARDRAKTS